MLAAFFFAAKFNIFSKSFSRILTHKMGESWGGDKASVN